MDSDTATMSLIIQKALITYEFQCSEPIYILILGFAITFFLGKIFRQESSRITLV